MSTPNTLRISRWNDWPEAFGRKRFEMAVSVSLPIKIRGDRTVLVEHPCWVDEAVSSALGRALANSRGAVLDTRGGFVGVNVHQPTFAWSGMALQDRDRARFERQMSELIAEVAQRERVWSAPLGP